MIKKKPNFPKGHRSHKSGNDFHKDKRTKRNRTKSSIKRNVLKEFV